MQYSQKNFGSQNAVKQLCRQHSTTFKNNQSDLNKPMTQSSNFPLNKMYNAFNSSANIKNLSLEGFKNSEAKSIIEKLMQTSDFPHGHNRHHQHNPYNLNDINDHAQEQQILLINQLQNYQLAQSNQPIPLSHTQSKIFCEVINLITEIAEIKEKTQVQKGQFTKLRKQLKDQGIHFPVLQESKSEPNAQIFRRFTKEELQSMFQENQRLQAEIQKITKDLTNKNQQQQDQSILQNILKQNSIIKKQTTTLKSQILNTGQIDEDQMKELTLKVQSLQKDIYILQQKRLGRLTERDEELIFLKSQNQRLRFRTIQLLRKQSPPRRNQRKQQLISILKIQQDHKQEYIEEMANLKSRYQSLLDRNSSLHREQANKTNRQANQTNEWANRANGYYDGPLQVESKVSPFQNTYGQYHSSYGNDKQNYYQNYEPNINNRRTSSRNTFAKYNNQNGNYNGSY